MILQNLYDSHVHWLMTGESVSGLNLSTLRGFDDLQKIQWLSSYDRGEWVYGFGWNENHFDDNFFPHRSWLDKIFPDRPVFFVRTDGHSSWVNTKALSLLGYLERSDDPLSKYIEIDKEGLPTGVLRETAHMKVYSLLGDKTKEQLKTELLAGMECFIKNGFTHIRDMTTQPNQWLAELDLFHSNKINFHVEHNFVCENFEGLDSTLEILKNCKKEETPYLKIRGAKIFYDGSLGSRTAALSQKYADQSIENQGMLLWSEKQLAEALKIFWKNQFEVSVHVIGDAAAHSAVNVARKVSAEGFVGILNLEHVQLLRPETITLMKPLHLRCHMQPCHWLSDRTWLRDRLGPLFQYAFPWESLSKAGVNLQFGSDSPIEPASYFKNQEALEKSSKEGIRKLSKDSMPFFLYKEMDAIAGSTRIEDQLIKEVRFDGRVVF